MNKIAKRLVAGASAAALLVSAVGIDQLADLFTKTSYAEYSSKTAKSTGFNNLEQDTDKDSNYNTGYGLHTNKTATALDDGRTFNVNLESWYVGENPVDVATILDASGSMAWTVDTLEPLELDATSLGIDVDELKTKYSITDDELKAVEDDYGTGVLAALAAIQNKKENGGYLPQDVVDLILDKTKTDDSKLSYAGYKYYVYENRSSVSEFVPLGYWDGGKTAEKFSPIGYYPFNGTLENKAPDGTTATAIKKVSSGSTFDNTALDDVPVELQFKNSGLSLSEVDKQGNVIIDLSGQNLDTTDTITLSFQAYFDDIRSGDGTPLSPIIYLGDGTKSNYVGLFRGRSKNNSNGASRGLYFYNNNSNKTGKDQILNNYYGKWNDCEITINGNKVSFSIKNGSNELWSFTDQECTLNLNSDKLYLILGGNEVLDHGDLIDTPEIDPTNLKGNYIKNLKISGTKSTGDDFSAEFSLQNKDDGLTDSTSGIEVKYCQQSSGNEFDVSNLAVTSPVVYTDNALNLTQTAKKNSAVKLDAKPIDSTYTIMFKVKTSAKLDGAATNNNHNLFYIGPENTDNNYYKIGIPGDSGAKHLHFYEKDKKLTGDFSANNGVFSDTNFKYVAYVINGTEINSYFDITKDKDTIEKKGTTTLDNELTTDINIILAGLIDTYSNSADISIDDLYIFDEALDEDQVKLVAENAGKTEFAILPSALSGSGTCGGYHATMKDTDVDIAQISERLAQNTNDEERRGWYYVNSHSKWADIEGCLESGKQYIGIYDKDKDNGIDNVGDAGRDIATIPSGADSDLKTAIKAGNTDDGTADHKKFNKAPDNERSIRFYVDSQNHLRCFAWSGSTSKDGDIRTFCSLVYEKGYNDDDNSEQITKYEELNNALNTFYQKIAEKSDLSNNAVVRFSTNSAINTDNTTGTEKTKENLKKLIMKDWTNWSDYYQKYKEDNSGSEPKTKDYLQNLLIPDDGETAVPVSGTEYPYVMTGGTYTWTGLKAFYDNMVKNEDSQTAKDIANDARDKYLIIFTDGRDNTQDYSVSEATDDTPAGSPVYDGLTKDNSTFGKENYVNKYNPYAGEDHKVGFSFEYYDKDSDNKVPQFKKGVRDITKDGDLAQAWADKLKDEGYTIYCVMMASGSISPTANEAEYNKAKNFLKSLSGSNELDAQIAQMQNAIDIDDKPDVIASKQQAIEALRDEYVIVVDPTVTGGMTVTKAFQQILEDIQLPRNDYTVQDYIDPRFDLVDADGNLYKLGAGGKITVTKDGEAVTGLKYSDGSTFTNGNAVGNIIDSIDNGTTVKGLPYTPRESYMVNRKADSKGKDGYDTGNIGTGYIYYDDVKDMYYLRWTDQIIPMENEAFDTATDHKNLDVWSATIRLKAKDDFIGGNNILTNGNEAGENLVFSDATIENMTDNPELYGLTADSTYRQKLAVLSGTDRKINAVDADGVSQAVYGNGIDIPSSGFPRTTVNVRLLKLDAKNLNDVIYMGEVVSPTMMLADLEDGYMTGSYYLQYLERYAYRVYGDKADSMPLIELLNKWLKIDDKNQEKKTFTIPYIYLPDPEYDENGKLARDTATNKVNIQNSTGASWDGNDIDFADLNLRDVTGFITYTWKRDDEDVNGDGTIEGNEREPQQVDSATGKYDITKDYVAKNTKQIKYNLQLKFTPLKETAEELKDFKLDEYFIIADPTAGTGGDKFFNIVSGEFNDTSVTAWTTNYGRADYLKAMVKEERTYTPHVMYDATAGEGVNKGKWELVATGEEKTACETYADGDDQITDNGNKTVTDSGVYDWDSTYKEAPGNAQLEGGTSGDDVKNIKGYYTTTPNNVKMLNASGGEITDDKGAIDASEEPVSLAANTTYTKDVVNAALALELFVDGKYLNQGLADTIKDADGLSYTFDAVRYYDDPIDPPPYDEEHPIGADTNATDGQKYQLTFKVDPDSLPKETSQENTIYKVWAYLDEVKVYDGSDYVDINKSVTESGSDYTGYTDINALPIGTYVIKTESDSATTKLNSLKNEQFKIGTNATGEDVNFKYLKIENDKQSYAYDKFPESVYTESDTAAESTKDGEYLIWNEDTSKDNSKKNIADNKRVKDSTTDTQTVTFYFGTVAEKKVGSETLINTKGVSVKEYLKEHPDDPTLAKFKNDYAKDRLGIIMLSADNNSLAITKEVKNTKKDEDIGHSWKFTITVKPDADDELFSSNLELTLKWYKSGEYKTAAQMNRLCAYTSDETSYPQTITFDESGGIYTATIYLKHDEKVVIDGLPEGTWQVTEDLGGVFCTPHNDQSEFGEDEWQYNRADSTRADGIDLTPASQVNYINEFPYELPSTGGSGTVRYLLMGTALISVGAMLFAVLFFDRRKKARK